MFVAAGFLVGLVVAVRAEHRHRIEQARQRAAIAARADYEHAAIMSGDDRYGTFGQYPPAPLVAGQIRC